MEGNPFEQHLSHSDKADAMDINKLVKEFGSNFTVTTQNKSSPASFEEEEEQESKETHVQKDAFPNPFEDDSADLQEEEDDSQEEEEEKEEPQKDVKTESRVNLGYTGRGSGPRKRRRGSVNKNNMHREYERTEWVPPKVHHRQRLRQPSLSLWDVCLRIGLAILGFGSLYFITSIIVLYQNVNNGLSLGASSAKAINDMTETVLPVVEKFLRYNHAVDDPVKELKLPPNHQLLLKQGPYELWAEPHNTTSYRLDYKLEIAKDTARILKAAFWHHMTTTPNGPKCICMHHLHMDRLPLTPQQKKNGLFHPILYQLCGVYNAKQQQIYMMANPYQSGGSRQGSVILSEHSVSCPVDHWRQVSRTESLFLDWVDPFTEETMYREFRGDESYCMQLALEEMAAPGNAHCQPTNNNNNNNNNNKKETKEDESRLLDVVDLNDVVIQPVEKGFLELTPEENKKLLEENTDLAKKAH